MKKTSKVLIALTICSLLCACGNTTQNVTNQDTTTQDITESVTTETVVKRYSLANEDEKAELISAMNDRDAIRCYQYMNGHQVPYSGIATFMDNLQKNVSSNIFTTELSTRYNELHLESKSDLEKDLFEILPMLMCDGWGYDDELTSLKGFTINTEEFGKVWTIGYSDKQLNNELPYNARAIILETTGGKQISENETVYVYFSAHVDENGILDCVTSFLDKDELMDITGIDVTTDTGNCVNSVPSMGTLTEYTQKIASIESAYTGMPYHSLTIDETRALLTEYHNYYELLKVFVDNEFFTYNPYSDTTKDEEMQRKAEIEAETARKKQIQPAIGMTEEEVLSGAWGRPNKKNISEYEWGTEEQWVYDNYGYIYFENGIVTAIQRHEDY